MAEHIQTELTVQDTVLVQILPASVLTRVFVWRLNDPSNSALTEIIQGLTGAETRMMANMEQTATGPTFSSATSGTVNVVIRMSAAQVTLQNEREQQNTEPETPTGIPATYIYIGAGVGGLLLLLCGGMVMFSPGGSRSSRLQDQSEQRVLRQPYNAPLQAPRPERQLRSKKDAAPWDADNDRSASRSGGGEQPQRSRKPLGGDDEPPRRTRSDNVGDDDQPPRRSRSKNFGDEDEPPRRSRSKSFAEEEEPPRRSRSKSFADDDDEPPRRARGAADDEEPRRNPVRSRSQAEDDDEMRSQSSAGSQASAGPQSRRAGRRHPGRPRKR